MAHFLEVSFGLGPIGPFRAAIALTVVALLLVLTWEENFGGETAEPAGAAAKPKKAQKKRGGGDAADAADAAGGESIASRGAESPGVLAALLEAGRLMRADSRLWMLGIMQACFEGGMFAWVSQWYPALYEVKDPADSLPGGLVFSCFMLCISIGANLYSCTQSVVGVPHTTAIALLLAMVTMLLPLLVPYPPSFALTMGTFCAFEVTVGALFPALGVMRAKIIPTGIQSTM